MYGEKLHHSNLISQRWTGSAGCGFRIFVLTNYYYATLYHTRGHNSRYVYCGTHGVFTIVQLRVVLLKTMHCLAQQAAGVSRLNRTPDGCCIRMGGSLGR